MNARVAIVGSGIAGLSAAHHLHGHADICLFEAGDYFGGHTHTVDITLAGANGHVSYGVDTGFRFVGSYPVRSKAGRGCKLIFG